MASLNPELTELSLEQLRLRRSAKWQFYDEDVLPAWVAEMDFPLAPAVKIALAEAVELSDTGYGYPPKLGLAEAFVDFARKRLGWEVDPERVGALPDVVNGITSVLRLLAGLVAFIGVLSSLMALQLERARELGVLRANGMTPGQVWQLVTTQTGLMGLAAGLLSLPVGLTLAAIMIYVVNRRSFGWTIRMELGPQILLEALALALAAALLAGLYPAFKMARTSPALALREE